MSSRWTFQGSLREEEIQNHQQEIDRLKQRLSKLERRKGLSSFAQDFANIQPRNKSISLVAYKSSIQTEYLRTDDDDEVISDDQISSTHEDVLEEEPRQSSTATSVEFSFEEFEDPLSKSSSLPIFDEPRYDVYTDDMFFEVLDVDMLVNNDDKSKPIQGVIAKKNNSGDECTGNANAMIPSFGCIYDGGGITELKKGDHILPIFTGECKESVPCFGLGAIGIGAAEGARIVVPNKSIPSTYATLERFKVGRQVDTGWIYPDRFSQPNPPASCG